MDEVVLRPVGFIRGGRSEPRDDDWATEVCEIELDAERFEAGALAGSTRSARARLRREVHGDGSMAEPCVRLFGGPYYNNGSTSTPMR